MGRFSLKTSLPPQLYDAQHRIEAEARRQGLDFFPVIFEMVAYEQMNEIAAYGGFPTRYPHWRFGMEYERMAKSYEYGLATIYEMVINNNPSVAYLLEGNSFVDQKLVMAHVYAHVDFFKNNFEFALTDQGTDAESGDTIRKWVDTMANHGATVRRWSSRYGQTTVEEFIDQCLRLENLLAPRDDYRFEKAPIFEYDEPPQAQEPSLIRVDREYMEGFINPQEFVARQRQKLEEERALSTKVPVRPTRDVLGFFLEHAPLERWEREVLAIVRTEALYFRPQALTKIMNEGWATYWHSRLMTEHFCEGEEVVDYADRCAGVLATRSDQLNPYKLGLELYRHIEDRWNRGRFGRGWDECEDVEARLHWDRRTNLGKRKIFEVRALYNDVTFIDEFLTPEFVVQQKLYTFGYNGRSDRWEIETRQFHQVKERLLATLANGGHPFIEVADSNHSNRGELLLRHRHHGVDLRLDWANDVLAAMERVWKRPVELSTLVESKPMHLRMASGEASQHAV